MRLTCEQLRMRVCLYSNTLYAFVIDGEVAYVCQTTRMSGMLGTPYVFSCRR